MITNFFDTGRWLLEDSSEGRICEGELQRSLKASQYTPRFMIKYKYHFLEKLVLLNIESILLQSNFTYISRRRAFPIAYIRIMSK